MASDHGSATSLSTVLFISDGGRLTTNPGPLITGSVGVSRSVPHDEEDETIAVRIADVNPSGIANTRAVTFVTEGSHNPQIQQPRRK